MENEEEESGSNGEEEEENGDGEEKSTAGEGASAPASVEIEASFIFRGRNSVDLDFGELDDVGGRRRKGFSIAGVYRSGGIREKRTRVRICGMNAFGHG